jgi:ribosomal protein S21
MTKYRLYYVDYPFNVEKFKPLIEYVEAETLDDAFKQLKENHDNNIEIIGEKKAREYYNEPPTR